MLHQDSKAIWVFFPWCFTAAYLILDAIQISLNPPMILRNIFFFFNCSLRNKECVSSELSWFLFPPHGLVECFKSRFYPSMKIKSVTRHVM